jgi:hypothetical protein
MRRSSWTQYQPLISLMGWGLLAAGLLLGCATGTAITAKTPSSESPLPSAELFPGGFLTIHPGQADAEDRFLSAVMVIINRSSQRGATEGCSGVLIHPRMAITAAHCACGRRAPTREDVASRAGGKAASNLPQQAGAITRSSALRDVLITEISDARSPCLRNVEVHSVSYVSEDATSSVMRPAQITGQVVIHPGFEIIFGRQTGGSHVVWSNADLAVIFLERPVPFALPPLELADSEVQPADIITLVGFSFGTSSPPFYGVRHFGANRVSRLIPLETGSTVFRVEEQVLPDGGTASHAQLGDSGGACIKRGAKNLLVGITTMGAMKPNGEPMSFFTSVYSHRSWLVQMLKRADET